MGFFSNSSLEKEDRIEALLNTTYWIIDILPFQVPKDSPGQYFCH